MSQTESTTFFLVPARRRPSRGAHVAALVLTALAAEYSRTFWVAGSEAALIWPPAGLALGLALVFGLRILPTMSAGLLLWAVALRGMPFGDWLPPAIGLVCGPAVASITLRRLVTSGRTEGPVRELVAFWCAALLAAGLSSLFGTVAVLRQTAFGDYAVGTIWASYWTAESFGLLVFAPATVRLADALAGRRRPGFAELQRAHAIWAAALALLAAAQFGLGAAGASGFASALLYLYFPLLALCAGLGNTLFTDTATALIATGIVALSLNGLAGLPQPTTNRELIDMILLVLAVTVMTQLVAAMAEALKRHLARARRMAYRDYLTDLANERELARWLEGAAREPTSLALIDFAAARRALDLFGLERANEIEQRIATRLAHLAGRGTGIARVGRGLYALHTHTPDAGAVEHMVTRVHDSLDGVRFSDGGVPLTLRPVIGAVLLSPGAESVDDTLALASQSLGQARATTGRRVLVQHADPTILTAARATQDTVERIRSAVRSDAGFVLMAQRIAPLQESGAAHGPDYEILLRLPDGDGRLQSPVQFLDVAARFGLMPEIDRWVIEHALAALARSGEASVSINLSGTSLADASLAEWIRARRAYHGVDPARVCFEITETEAIERQDTARVIVDALRGQGFQIALDDFGTGLASFDYVRQFDFDYLKIDGSFVRAARDSETERAMVEAVQRVAATAGIRTIAEFVEDEATIEWLRAIGVDFAQGFGIAMPVPLEQAVPVRRTDTSADPAPRTPGTAFAWAGTYRDDSC